MAQRTVTVEPELLVGVGRSPAPGWRRLLVAVRPAGFVVVAAVVVGAVGVPAYNPTSPRFEYALRAAVVGLALLGAAGWWWSARRGRGRWRSWGADLVPALVGGAGALVLVGSLNGTPYAPGGIEADQSFRTAAVTRFADSAQNADFTFQGLPSFYAPGYFWVLGRIADLAAVEPWRMVKLGTVLMALLVPLVTYLLWRRLVPEHVAALVAVVPLVVQNAYEPYAWLVLFAIVPWWLEAVHGLRRPGVRAWHPVFLGLIGAALFLTYYYFFFVAAIGLLVWLGLERASGGDRVPWRQVGRAAVVLAIAAAAAAVYWLPLLVSILRAGHPESLANRWFSDSHPHLPLPMLEGTAVGAVALLGLGYLFWTVRREPLSRGLLALLAAAYLWYLVGAPAAVADTPLLSFRGKPLIPMLLLVAGVLALDRVVRAAAGRFEAADVRRVAWGLGLALVVYVGQGFVGTVLDSELVRVAHATAWPDGRLPAHHAGEVRQPGPPATVLHQAISERLPGRRQAVLLSDRTDILVLYPYHGFLQWNAHYAHPAAEFHERVRFLVELAGASGPDEFARRSATGRFGRIDGFVLRAEGDELVVRFADDAFPGGTRTREVRFPRALVAPDAFDLLPMGDHLLAIRR